MYTNPVHFMTISQMGYQGLRSISTSLNWFVNRESIYDHTEQLLSLTYLYVSAVRLEQNGEAAAVITNVGI